MNYRNAVLKYGRKIATGVALAAPMVSMAQTGPSQPDPSSAVTYITAGAATLLLVANGKYIVLGVKWVAAKVGSMLGR